MEHQISRESPALQVLDPASIAGFVNRIQTEDENSILLTLVQFGEFLQRKYPKLRNDDVRKILPRHLSIPLINNDLLILLGSLFEAKAVLLQRHADDTDRGSGSPIATLAALSKGLVAIGELIPDFEVRLCEVGSQVTDAKINSRIDFIERDFIPNTPQRLEVEKTINDVRTKNVRAARELFNESNRYFGSPKTIFSTQLFKARSRKVVETESSEAKGVLKELLQNVLSAIDKVVTIGEAVIKSAQIKFNLAVEEYNKREPVSDIIGIPRP